MRKFVAGVASASIVLVLGAVVPASASPAPASEVTFWSGAFTGEKVSYADPGTDCTDLPFVVHSELNLSSTGIFVHQGKGCTGLALFFPANDIHSFIRFDGGSFRAAG